jgi:hypothetical protein
VNTNIQKVRSHQLEKVSKKAQGSKTIM